MFTAGGRCSEHALVPNPEPEALIAGDPVILRVHPGAPPFRSRLYAVRIGTGGCAPLTVPGRNQPTRCSLLTLTMLVEVETVAAHYLTGCY
jgi:hypothetical protein